MIMPTALKGGLLSLVVFFLNVSQNTHALLATNPTKTATIVNNRMHCTDHSALTMTTAAEKCEDDTVENNSNSEYSSFQNILLTRRTINEFASDLPDNCEDALERAIEAATFAPNHKRTEPWRFHLLGEKSIRNVCELNAKLVTAKKGEEAGKKKLDRWLAMPGWLVVTCVKQQKTSKSENMNGKNRLKRWLTVPRRLVGLDKKDGNDEESFSMDDPSGIAREDYAACCCAVQNLCLSLHAEGIGTKWTTGPVNFDSGFAKAVGMPSDEYVVGTIWFGTPSKLPNPPPKKLSVSEVLTKQD